MPVKHSGKKGAAGSFWHCFFREPAEIGKTTPAHDAFKHQELVRRGFGTREEQAVGCATGKERKLADVAAIPWRAKSLVHAEERCFRKAEPYIPVHPQKQAPRGNHSEG